MSAITVAYAAVAAGNLLWRLAGQDGLPPLVGSGVELWNRLASLTKAGRRNAAVKRAIQSALGQNEYAAADAGDVRAADEAVARVLEGVPADERLCAAVRDRDELHALVAGQAATERASLLSEPAQAVFGFILGATEAFLVKTAFESDDFLKLANQEELRDLADMGGEIRELAAHMLQGPGETVRLLAGPVLTINPPVTPTGLSIEPSRLLVPTSGAFPFVDRGDRLNELLAWVDDPAPFGVHIVGGLGGSGKSRLAVELCRRLESERGGYWRAGFLGGDATGTAIAGLANVRGGRLIVMDYAETRALDVALILTSLIASGTWLQPVRVLLLVRNPAPAPTGRPQLLDDPGPWRLAVRAPRQETANALLDEAGCTLLNIDALAFDDRARLFQDAVRRLPAYLGQPTVAQTQLIDTGFLATPEFEQPLNVALAAYLWVAGNQPITHDPEALLEGVLDHEVEYWRRLAAAPDVLLDLTGPELRLLVALITLTDAHDDAEGRRLLSQVDFLGGQSNALRLGRASAWALRLYPIEGHLWGQLLPDRLGEYIVAKQMSARSELIRAALSPDRDPVEWVRPLRTLTRACADHADLGTTAATVLGELLFPLTLRCREMASGPDPWESQAVIDALAGLVEAVGGSCMPGPLIESARLLGMGNRLTASLCLAVGRSAVEAAPTESEPQVRAEALSFYAIVLAGTGRRDEAVVLAREAVGANRALAQADPAAFTPALAGSLSNYANTLLEIGQRDEAVALAREAVGAYRALAQADPAVYTPDLAGSLSNYANTLVACRL